MTKKQGILTQVIEYEHGDTLLQGYLAYAESTEGRPPGVLVVHDWLGIAPYTKGRVEELAKFGYTAFAIDMYGKSVRPRSSEEASKQVAIYREDRQLMRARANAGLEILEKHPHTDNKRIAAVGYSFGGGTVLEMARGGAALAGVVSFYGNLDTPDPADASNISGKVLILHGSEDPFVKTEQIFAFQEEMSQAGVDWQMVIYGGAVHGFADPESGHDTSTGVAYSERADIRSWEVMKLFLSEIFSESKESR